jgi:hypothetical protein
VRSLAALALAACLSAAAGCDASGVPALSKPSRAPRDAEPGSSAVAPIEPWRFSPVPSGDALVLPPPCVARAPTQRAMLPRASRIRAADDVLATLLVAEGAVIPRWKPDSAALLHFGRRPRATPLMWPDRGEPLLARATSDQWLVAFAEPTPTLWRDGRRHALDHRPVDFACRGERCALLLAKGNGTQLLDGSADTPLRRWRRTDVEGGAVAIAALSPTPLAAVMRGEDVVFVDASDHERARAGASHGVLDAIAAPKPLALAYAGPPDPSSCAPEAGGVRVLDGDGHATRLRSAYRANGGVLRALAGATLAVWTAPARCGAPRKAVHAAVLDERGRSIAPVTLMGRADQVAVASHGEQIDLWLARDRMVTWARGRCPVPRAAR